MDTDVTKERLLGAALEIFAAQGYHAASTRDICRAAEAGNAAIHYHFGDKAAIYRELFTRLLHRYETRMRTVDLDAHDGRDALVAYYGALLQPMTDAADLARQMYLHQHEEFNPTGIVDDLLPRGLSLQFEILGGFLQRQLKVARLDTALQRLVLALHGLAIIYVVKRRAIVTAMPGVMEGPQWLQRLAGHLADEGFALVEAERQRREGLARRRATLS